MACGAICTHHLHTFAFLKATVQSESHNQHVCRFFEFTKLVSKDLVAHPSSPTTSMWLCDKVHLPVLGNFSQLLLKRGGIKY